MHRCYIHRRFLLLFCNLFCQGKKMSQYQCVIQRDSSLMTTSWHGNAFCITGPLWGESTRDWWIPLSKDQWCRALMIPLMSAWTNCWINSQGAGELRCLDTHMTLLYDDVLFSSIFFKTLELWLKWTIFNSLWQDQITGAKNNFLHSINYTKWICCHFD